MAKNTKFLKVKNAHEHNLKNINVSIPHQSLTVITGVSGSGKSSLAYSVIYKESQRRFLESFSAYSRQYLGKLEKAKFDEISGLQPALSIEQKTQVANPRSTVGTISGVYDYLRLLYARIGTVSCYHCNTIFKTPSKACPSCTSPQKEIQAKLFSFNSKYGACSSCNGLGVSEKIDKKKLIADENKTLAEGALVPTTPTGYIVYSQVRVDELDKVCQAHGFSVDIPWKDLSQEQQDVIWYGSDRVKILFGKHSLESRLKWKGITAKPREEAFYKGMIPIMEEILKRDRNDNILRFTSSFTCDECQGQKLNKTALSVRIDNRTIAELSCLSLTDLNDYLKSLHHKLEKTEVLDHILKQVFKRLEYLILLGLDYLTLERESKTLSGGEAQRIRLASQVGSGLQGILYILDEPSIGLHPRDNKKLIKVLQNLRDNGNTVVIVEHDEETIRAADYLIDIGPSAGLNGGDVVFQGNPNELFEHQEKYPLSKTAQSISIQSEITEKDKIMEGHPSIFIKGASTFNLKSIDVEFKLKAFNVITGVSGAGKSTLVHEVLAKSLREKKTNGKNELVQVDREISRIIEIDQSPIGRTPRSNPATYTDLFDHIRDLFGKLPESKIRGYKKGRFSFNNTGGRCEHCQGAGSIQLGMHFLGDVEITCEHCDGQRFNKETLEIEYQGKNIYDILELSITEARTFFDGQTKITKILDQLIKLDVGYLKLGQPSTTLSGGEAQRIKLASELYKTSKGHALYILDEPTTGLHMADIKFLTKALKDIIKNDNTVIIIEHDLEIIQQADWIIDLGPEGGEKGGQLVVQGSLKEIMACKPSFTGQALKEYFKKDKQTHSTPQKELFNSNIKFSGVKTNNLQNIDIEIPINKTTVITGVSGSGKSSLAFDTIFAESRNRFTENLSSYARRMMSKVKKPELEQCSGLTPAIAIKQSQFKKNPRSTVGTVSEIFDLYRLLFSRSGTDANGLPNTLPASMFSFNKLEAACEHCKGLGIVTIADAEKFITHPEKSILNGAMDGSLPGKFFGDIYGQYINTLLKVAELRNIDFDIPFTELSSFIKEIVLNGTGDIEYDVEWKFKRGNRTGTHQLKTPWKGFIQLLTGEYELKRNSTRVSAYQPIMSDMECPKCQGERFKEDILKITFNDLNISQMSKMSIKNAKGFFANLINNLDAKTLNKSEQIIKQLLHKFEILENIGLAYLAIDRATSSLSGGEAQRLRIATQLVSNLCGLTYVLDEPSVGLHSSDTEKLMNTIQQLKDNGNTIILVEHDPDIIKKADHIIDMGPKAGEFGGQIIAKGSLAKIMKNPNSITGQSLRKNEAEYIYKSEEKEKIFSTGLRIKGAHANNLKNIDLEIPKGRLISMTGVSGSGKTSLAFDVIAASYNAGRAINCKEISILNFESLTMINQEKIGVSPLSTSATYTGVFDHIRDLFAKLDESKKQSFKKSHFSFNSKDGSCPECKGMGQVKVSMDFLSDVWTTCDQCHGKRYQDKVLEIKHKGHSIFDVLNLSIHHALDLFEQEIKIKKVLEILDELGLGYIKLGQATSSLSGGETQRLKLAHKLLDSHQQNALFIFDEPTTGLHMQDIEVLLKVFAKLIDKGNTVLAIEHNLDIIKASDWIIDLGPNGGDEGGEVLYSGSVAGLKGNMKSQTAAYL